MHDAAASQPRWTSAGIAGSALAVFLLAFLPWFELDVQQGVDLESVVPSGKSGWDTALGAVAVLAALLGGVLALIPQAVRRGWQVAPAVVAAVLVLLRLAFVPSATVLGESLPYSRTAWVVLVAAAAVLEATIAIVGTSHRKHAQVG